MAVEAGRGHGGCDEVVLRPLTPDEAVEAERGRGGQDKALEAKCGRGGQDK